jgi:hypothetical protein
VSRSCSRSPLCMSAPCLASYAPPGGVFLKPLADSRDGHRSTDSFGIVSTGSVAVGAYVAEQLKREMNVAAKNTAPETCKHPINRRIGTGCGLCLKDPVK